MDYRFDFVRVRVSGQPNRFMSVLYCIPPHYIFYIKTVKTKFLFDSCYWSFLGNNDWFLMMENQRKKLKWIWSFWLPFFRFFLLQEKVNPIFSWCSQDGARNSLSQSVTENDTLTCIFKIFRVEISNQGRKTLGVMGDQTWRRDLKNAQDEDWTDWTVFWSQSWR